MTYRQQLVALFVAALVSFAAIALDVTHHGVLARHDARVGLWVGAHTPRAIERLAEAITTLGGAGSLVVLTALGVALLLRRGSRTDAAFLIGGLALVSLATNGLKIAFGRPRPSLHSLTPISHTSSFPSGHTSSSLVVFVLVAVLLAKGHRRAAIVGAVLLAGLVGVTRVVVEAHWTTDVLAGYSLGAGVLAVVLVTRDELSGRSRPVGPDAERDS